MPISKESLAALAGPKLQDFRFWLKDKADQARGHYRGYLPPTRRILLKRLGVNNGQKKNS